jgi:hypothetical protein
MSKQLTNLIFILLALSTYNCSKLRSMKLDPMTSVANHIQLKLTNLFKNKQEEATITEEPDKNEQPEEVEDKHFIVHEPCNADNCASPNMCINGSTCKCAHGFAHTHVDGGKLCTYPQKRQLLAFFLELLFASGVGHLYAGRLVYGIIKMCFILIIPAVLLFWAFYSKEKNSIILIILSTLCFLVLTWHLVDLVMLGMNKYNDGEGVPLLQWG